MDWLLQRFKNLGKTEIEKMLLAELPDLQETKSGKDLIAIGIEKLVQYWCPFVKRNRGLPGTLKWFGIMLIYSSE